MANKKFKIEKYFTSFCTYEVIAENKREAYTKIENYETNNSEIISNLERLNQADTIEEC